MGIAEYGENGQVTVSKAFAYAVSIRSKSVSVKPKRNWTERKNKKEEKIKWTLPTTFEFKILNFWFWLAQNALRWRMVGMGFERQTTDEWRINLIHQLIVPSVGVVKWPFFNDPCSNPAEVNVQLFVQKIVCKVKMGGRLAHSKRTNCMELGEGKFD